MNCEDMPKCMSCKCDITVGSILTKCGDFAFAEIIQRYNDWENMSQLLTINVTETFNLLQNTKLLKLI